MNHIPSLSSNRGEDNLSATSLGWRSSVHEHMNLQLFFLLSLHYCTTRLKNPKCQIYTLLSLILLFTWLLYNIDDRSYLYNFSTSWVLIKIPTKSRAKTKLKKYKDSNDQPFNKFYHILLPTHFLALSITTTTNVSMYACINYNQKHINSALTTVTTAHYTKHSKNITNDV